MSEALLAEVTICLEPPQFTEKLKANVTEESLNAHVLAQQVKIGSLLRCMDLLEILNAELPERISKQKKLADQVKREAETLAGREAERMNEIENLQREQENILRQVREIVACIRARREEQAICNAFFKENEWDLHKRITELQRKLIQGGGDSEVLAKKIDQNEKIISKIHNFFQNSV